MKYFLALIALAALPAREGPRPAIPVALYAQFEHDPSPAAFDAIREEVQKIMSPVGFPFEWKALSAAHGDEMAAQLAVITFKGSCRATNLSADRNSSGPLGVTHIGDGIVLPYADIDCDRIRDFLRKGLIGAEANDRDRALGRAVGRVVAHELFHVFAGAKYHLSHGVAKPAFTEQELLADRFVFAASEFRVLRGSLKPARMLMSRLRPAASPLSGQSIFQESGCASCHGTLGEGTRFAPALRATSGARDAKVLAAKLAREGKGMFTRTRHPRLPNLVLDDDEVADVVSFLTAEL
jgi:cytochrome c551/c552